MSSNLPNCVWHKGVDPLVCVPYGLKRFCSTNPAFFPSSKSLFLEAARCVFVPQSLQNLKMYVTGKFSAAAGIRGCTKSYMYDWHCEQYLLVYNSAKMNPSFFWKLHSQQPQSMQANQDYNVSRYCCATERKRSLLM